MAGLATACSGIQNEDQKRFLCLVSATRYVTSGSSLNPISKVRTSSKRLREKDVLTPEEFQALLKELSVRDLAMVLLIGSTGVRRSELMALVWTDINVETMEVSITKILRAQSVR